MDYTVEHYSEPVDDVLSDHFQAAGDEEALAHARSVYGEDIHIVCRVESEENRNVHHVIWERNPQLVLKWIADGCATLDEVIAALEGFAGELKELRAQGLELSQPVDNGNIILERPAGQRLPSP